MLIAAANPYIPLVAVVISAVVSAAISIYSAKRSIKAEIAKLRLGTQQRLLELLVLNRLDAYPKIYKQLNSLIWSIDGGSLEPQGLSERLEDVEAWDGQYGLLLGPHCSNVYFSFRMSLAAVAAKSNESPSSGDIQLLRRNAELLELALRSDVGVYGVEVSDVPDDLELPNVETY